MIQSLRYIAQPSFAENSRQCPRWAVNSARLIALFTVFVFFMDTINIDVLYAGMKGNIRFEDNPLILDSQFDTTPVAQNTGNTTNYFSLVKSTATRTELSSKSIKKFFGTTIIEDVDSPTVLDGSSTATLEYYLRPFFIFSEVQKPCPPTIFNRTITFLCLLI